MKKILIIDDEKDLCFLLQSYLKFKHHEVVTANTLKDGLNKINTFHPDVLFLDNNLPDGFGWNKACEILETNPGIKINLMTGQTAFDIDVCDEHFNIIEKPLSYSKVDMSLVN
jgi:two-component system OmpR family response regulator